MATLLAAGCATSGTWREITTTSFVLRTDLDAPSAMRAAEALEATRDALISAAWPGFAFGNRQPTDVYVLSSVVDFREHFGHDTSGVFFHGSGMSPTFVLGGAAEQWAVPPRLWAGSSPLRHELAHQLAAEVYPRQSRWFSEGLADFLETVHYSDDQGSVVIGAVNWPVLRAYGRDRTVTVRQLLGWERPGGAHPPMAEAGGYYALSWALFHYLFNAQPEPFARFQIELAKGTEPARAWQTAFPAFDPEDTDRQIDRYVRHGDYIETPMPLRQGTRTTTELQLSPPEVHVARATIALLGRGPARGLSRPRSVRSTCCLTA
jgi:hypothetical protein